MKRTQRTYTKILLSLAWIVAAAWGCSSGEEDYGPDPDQTQEPAPIPNDGPVPPQTSLQCENGTNLTFQNFGESFLSAYCLSCHHSSVEESDRSGAPIDANFDTAYLTQVWRALIIQKAAGDAPTMPPAQSIPSYERKEFAEWLNCGAPSQE